MHAHWGGIQPECKLRAALHDIHFKKLDNPGLGLLTGSAVQPTCCQTLINLKQAVTTVSSDSGSTYVQGQCFAVRFDLRTKVMRT